MNPFVSIQLLEFWNQGMIPPFATSPLEHHSKKGGRLSMRLEKEKNRKSQVYFWNPTEKRFIFQFKAPQYAQTKVTLTTNCKTLEFSENDLTELYETWDKPKKAEEWRAKLLQIKTAEE
jgi:hypothetical protein